MQAVTIKKILSEEFVEAADWRADYHLSTAAILPVLAKQRKWPHLTDYKVKFVDGWRFSESPESEWYMANVSLLDTSKRDPITLNYLPKVVDEETKALAKDIEDTLSGERYYRMRHVADMRLNPERGQYLTPLLSFESCVKPSDVVVRRVGSASAAYVSEFDRQHPIDANMAIVRGLNRYDALWLTYCLQQPLYVDYLENRIRKEEMVRVGLSQLKNMPLAPTPSEFCSLAEYYFSCLERLYFTQMSLRDLREQVSKWLSEFLDNASISWNESEIKTAWFKAEDLSERLDFGYSEHSKVSHQLLANGGQYLSQLAMIEPKAEQKLPEQYQLLRIPEQYQLLRIKDIKSNFRLSDNLTQVDANDEDASKIVRVKKRLVQQNDVLLSTFAIESKVLWLNEKPSKETLASEHLATLSFQRHAGAYTLLLETPLIKWQLAQLVSGSVQAFINLSDLAKVTFPPLTNEIATRWHSELDTILKKQNQALTEMEQIRGQMAQVYNSVHPTLDEVNHAN
ncbi:hypothetical protein V9R53_002645 [Vibrio mimicus]